MKQFLTYALWIKPNGKINKKEIAIDLAVLSTVIAVVYSVVYFIKG